MFRRIFMCGLSLMIVAPLLVLTSCRSLPGSGEENTELPELKPTILEYIDSEGFDALLEIALVNQDPVIVIQTGRIQPDWSGRLNAWIAAWNRGGHGTNRKGARRASSAGGEEEAEEVPRVARGLTPLPQMNVDAEGIREFRLLVGGMLDRAEDLAQHSAAWWIEERARSRRVSLLRPYSLRFHKDEQDLIQLVLFHGSYAAYYPRYMQLLMQKQRMEDEKWTRSVECSCCQEKKKRDSVDQLMNREVEKR